MDLRIVSVQLLNRYEWFVCSAAIVVLQKRKVSHARLWGIERRRSLARRGISAEVELSTVAAFR